MQKTPSKFWQFFELFLRSLGALSIPFSNRLPTRQSECSCWYSVVFFSRKARKIFEPRTLESFTSYNQRSLCTKVCLQNAHLPSAQFWRCAPEKDVLVQDQLDGGEDVKRVVHHQGLFYIPEIIKTELTTKKTRELIAKEYYGDLQLLPIPTYRWKGTNYNSILVIVGRLTKMIHYKPAQITIDTPTLAAGCMPLSSIAVTTHASFMRTSIKNLMTICRKNFQRCLVT